MYLETELFKQPPYLAMLFSDLIHHLSGQQSKIIGYDKTIQN